MKTLIDKINEFEALPKQTVEEFNKIFTDKPLKDLMNHLEVEIGEIADTDTTRYLMVGNLIVKHSFAGKKDDNEEELRMPSNVSRNLKDQDWDF